jgi:hypothetical protein
MKPAQILCASEHGEGVMKASILKATLLALAMAGAAQAQGRAKEWKEDHPRRAEVNKRLENQNDRIKEGRENGTLTKGQAEQLHAEDHAIRQQERAEAATQGGHITKAQQRQLNREENKVSNQIYEEKH